MQNICHYSLSEASLGALLATGTFDTFVFFLGHLQFHASQGWLAYAEVVFLIGEIFYFVVGMQTISEANSARQVLFLYNVMIIMNIKPATYDGQICRKWGSA